MRRLWCFPSPLWSLNLLQAGSARLVAACLAAMKDKEVDDAITAMNPKDHGLLMMYIYRALSLNEQSTKLLQVHEKLVDKSGVGCINRALSDRMTV
mmetsp:Transcript_10681/g.25015  ORF Transcript_10681/g.25015 Transcript_10681/m.25015 type:complete len:96 (-) Transcript_10681:49-336(-)